jgi:hypothetical protein
MGREGSTSTTNFMATITVELKLDAQQQAQIRHKLLI